MEKLYEKFEEILADESLIYGVFSGLRRKDLDFNKVRIEPVLIKGLYNIQFSYEYKNKVIHENLNKEAALEKLKDLSFNDFRQVNLFTTREDIEVLISKKRKLRIGLKKPSRSRVDLSHNRKKEYILEDGVKHDFLIHLGIMDKNARVKPSRYDKFRQINRFLELVEDVMPRLEKEEDINIVDFGCGKSYLTFALYYYLVEILGRKVNIIGLDLKEDVIELCNKIAGELNYENLNFIHGDIKDFDLNGDIDMVVTLHACDTATDAAIVKAIGWNSKVLLSVPCCQAEIYSKLENSRLEPMLKHGIIKERLASLVTDSLRAEVLEACGYNVQLVEFIDMDHTPKNILIRAYKDKKIDQVASKEAYKDFKEFFKLEDLFIDRELEKIGRQIK